MAFNQHRCQMMGTIVSSQQLQSVDSNWHPRSVETVDGTPNWEIHPLKEAQATVCVVMSVIGRASGHRVKQLIQVSRLVKPREEERGPTMSRCILSNQASGMEKVDNGVTVWRWNSDSWQRGHDRTHHLTSVLIEGHIYLAMRRRCVARMPGWESECMESMTACQKLTGTMSLGIANLMTSQISDESMKSRKLRDEVDDCNLWRSGSLC